MPGLPCTSPEHYSPETGGVLFEFDVRRHLDEMASLAPPPPRVIAIWLFLSIWFLLDEVNILNDNVFRYFGGHVNEVQIMAEFVEDFHSVVVF